MPDHGARYTDQQIDAIEKRITALYDTAYNDVRRKYLAFIRKFKSEDEKYRQMLADGDITKVQYDAWLRGQVFQGERWKAQLSDIAQTLTNATIAATDVINENATNVFAMNANYAQYEIEKAGNADFGFGLYDEDTVRRLVRDDPNLLPPSKVDIPLEQQWNKTLINRQIGASIVIGEGIEAVAKRLQRAANMSANQARTHARTAMTGAQNAGRIEGYHRAEQMGIKLEKEWLATLDGHTRRSHAVLDGQHVPVDKPFKSLLGDIMYPGDPSARPANVYNCRCTLISHLLDYPSQNAQRRPNLQRLGDAEVQKPIKDMTYAEWAGWKNRSVRSFASGLRRQASIIISPEQIKEIRKDIRAIGADESLFVFNEGVQTGFVDAEEVIKIRYDVYPDLTSTRARDKLSVRAALAHEYYGHYMFHPSIFDIGDWRDEMRASYAAAFNAKGLSREERADLIVDAYDRAREAGYNYSYSKAARRILYGYE